MCIYFLISLHIIVKLNQEDNRSEETIYSGIVKSCLTTKVEAQTLNAANYLHAYTAG